MITEVERCKHFDRSVVLCLISIFGVSVALIFMIRKWELIFSLVYGPNNYSVAIAILIIFSLVVGYYSLKEYRLSRFRPDKKYTNV